MADTEAAQTPAQPARNPIYCGVCSLPPEYCEFGGTTKKCEEWLHGNHPDLHQQLYSEETLSANLSALTTKVRERSEKDAEKKAAKAASAEEREASKRAASKVIVRRIERNKRKYVTTISGLELFGYELKKIAKDFGKKFATGSSVTKVPSGGEEITVQGDVSGEVEEYILDVLKNVPEDNIELVEDKKKKGSAPA